MSQERKGPPEDLLLTGGQRILASEIEELASRSSGPGGQHVNTSSTRVSLRWNLVTARGISADARERLLRRLRSRISRDGTLIVHAERHRSRRRNQEDARARLREIVQTALYQSPPRKPTGPSRAARARRMDSKRRRGNLKNQRRIRSDED